MSNAVRDVVAPLVCGRWHEGSFAFETLAGTAFLIGRRGIAVTAAHVVDQMAACAGSALALVNPSGAWMSIRIVKSESHATEDVAVLQLEGSPWPSWLVISEASENQSFEYDSWGYPISVAELSAKYEEHRLQTPDLVFTRGYVRRRISKSLPTSIYRGTCFYELSEAAGNGCSGGPMIARKSLGQPTWDVSGVYVGECSAGFEAGYAVRSDAIASWIPGLIGRSLRQESLDL